MNKMQISICILAASVFIASVSQILLKMSANREHGSLLKEYLNPLVIGGYVLLFGSTILTMIALRVVPLSWSPVIESMSYIFVSVLGYFFLGERFSRRKVLGFAVILCGILIFSLGS